MTEERMSPGLVLRQEREKRGLSVDEVASQMRLSRSQIEALEAGDYTVLPGMVFVRGFIRNYAKLLQIDVAPLLDTVALPQESIEPPLDEGIPFPSGQKKSWVHYAIGFVVLAFLLLFIEIYRENHAPLKPVSSPAKPAPKAVAPVAPLQPVLPAEVAVSTPAAAPMEISQPSAVSAPMATGPIHLVFGAASWVEVRDASGKIVFSKLNQAGSEQYVSGNAPFSLVIGNAPQVKLFYEGKPVDLASYTKVEVARLTLK